MNTSERLKQLMSERGLKQVDILNASKPFQKSLGISMSKSTLSQYVGNKQSPDQDHLYLLAMTLNVSEPWLMGYDVPMQRQDSRENADSSIIKLSDIYSKLVDTRKRKVVNYASAQLREQETPSLSEHTSIIYLDGYVSAGYGEYMVDNNKREPVEVDGHVPNHDIVVKVNGDSMEPTFTNGQLLYVKKLTDPCLLRNGQFVIARIGDESYVKKFYKKENQVKLISLNPKYKDIIIKPEEDFEVIGTVII